MLKILQILSTLGSSKSLRNTAKVLRAAAGIRFLVFSSSNFLDEQKKCNILICCIYGYAQGSNKGPKIFDRPFNDF